MQNFVSSRNVDVDEEQGSNGQRNQKVKQGHQILKKDLSTLVTRNHSTKTERVKTRIHQEKSHPKPYKKT